jgi:hypothetical protein
MRIRVARTRQKIDLKSNKNLAFFATNQTEHLGNVSVCLALGFNKEPRCYSLNLMEIKLKLA